jgi:hypothetical protein
MNWSLIVLPRAFISSRRKISLGRSYMLVVLVKTIRPVS